MDKLRIGWNKANQLIQQLETLGGVAELNGKQLRRVLPSCIEDLNNELVAFMEEGDYPRESLICAFQERTGGYTNEHQYTKIE